MFEIRYADFFASYSYPWIFREKKEQDDGHEGSDVLFTDRETLRTNDVSFAR